MKNETKLGIAAVLLAIALLAFWPRSYAGRFVPRQGTNLALDNKTGHSCRMSGEKAPSDAEDFFKKYRVPPGFTPDAPNPIPLCSEIVDAETHREEVVMRFVGTGLLLLFGIYVIVRHWRKREAQDGPRQH